MEETQTAKSVVDPTSVSQPENMHQFVSRLKNAFNKNIASSCALYQQDDSLEKKTLQNTTEDHITSCNASNYVSETTTFSSHRPQHDLSSAYSSSSSTAAQTDYPNSETVTLKKLIKTLAERLKTAQEKNLSLEEQQNVAIEEKNEKNRALEKELCQLQRQKQEAIASTNLLQERLLTLSYSYEEEKKQAQDELKKICSQAQISLEKAEKEKITLKETLHKFERECATKKQPPSIIEPSPSSEHVHSLHTEISRLRNEVKEKESQLQKLSSKVTSSLSADTASNFRSKNHEAVTKMALSMKGLEDELHGIKCERVALKREISHLVEQLSKIELNYSKTHDEASSLLQKLSSCEQQLQEKEAQLERGATCNVEITQKLQTYSEQLFEVQNQLTQTKNELIDTQSRYSSLLEQNTDHVATIYNLTQQYTDQKIILDEKMKENVLLATKLEEVEQLLREKIQLSLNQDEELEFFKNEYERHTQGEKLFLDNKCKSDEEMRALQKGYTLLEEEKAQKSIDLQYTLAALEQANKTISDLETIFSASCQAYELMKKGHDILQRSYVKYNERQASNKEVGSSFVPTHTENSFTQDPVFQYPSSSQAASELTGFSSIHEKESHRHITPYNLF